MKLKLIGLFFFIATIGVHAQSARTILDNAASTYTKSGGISASFTLDMKEAKSGDTYSYDGTVKMKGDKFFIDIPDFSTWFDGTTQWVYVKGTDEVNITEPTKEELQGLSPALVFSIYKEGFDLVYKGQKTENGVSLLEVEMIPQTSNEQIKKIVVGVNKATYMFQKIVIHDQSGYENTLTIKKVQTNVSLSGSTFRFDKSQYPDAEIIDLREDR